MVRAIILAAGEGTRLAPITHSRPKCLVPLAGEPLLERQLRALADAGITDVTVVTGYRAEQIEAMGLATRHNERFGETNMVASLMCASDLLDGSADVVIAYGDLVYEPQVIRELLNAGLSSPMSVTVDRSWRRLWELRMPDPLDDAETLLLDGDLVVALGAKPTSFDEIQGQYMGLIGVSASYAPQLVETYDRLDPDGPFDGQDRDNMYMTSFLQHLIDQGTPVRAVLVDGGWLEVDTTDDLRTYDALAANGDLDQYCRLRGG